MTKIKIDVTQQDIWDGIGEDIKHNPIGQALNRQLKDYRLLPRYIQVGGELIKLPLSVVIFMSQSLENARPFSFDLEIPKQYIKQ